MNDLKYYTDLYGDIIFSFSSFKDNIGFDYYDDFLIIVKVIKDYFAPEKIVFQGITDIEGYFIKNEIKIDMKCTSMLGVFFSIPKERKINTNISEVYKLLNDIWHKAVEVKITIIGNYVGNTAQNLC